MFDETLQPTLDWKYFGQWLHLMLGHVMSLPGIVQPSKSLPSHLTIVCKLVIWIIKIWAHHKYIHTKAIYSILHIHVVFIFRFLLKARCFSEAWIISWKDKIKIQNKNSYYNLKHRDYHTTWLMKIKNTYVRIL